jgi:hypothetical protein
VKLNLSPPATALALLGCSGLLLISLGWYSLLAGGVPAWDFAADMLLGNRIRDEGVLLVGHYSRYEFNHPGPFWFYYNYLFELGLEHSGLSRTHIWLFGQTTMATLLLGFTGGGLSLFLFGKLRFWPALLAIFTLCGYLGADLLSLWMPHRLIAPYIAFLVCCLLLMQGRALLLPLATLLTGVLIHGYATMPLFTLLPLAVAVLLGWRAQQQAGINGAAITRSILAAALIAGVFVLPIAYDALYVSPSNLSKLLYAQHGFSFLAKPSWAEMLTFIDSLLPPQGLWLTLGVAIISLLALRPRLTIIRPALQASALLIGAALLLVLYYRRTPAPLYDFVALFATGIAPLLLASVLALALDQALRRANHSWSVQTLTVLAAFILVYLLAPFKPSPERAEQKISEFAEFADFIRGDLPREQIAAIDYANHDLWPFMAGLLLELDRQDIKACTTWRHMGFLYTDAATCPAQMLPQYLVVAAAQCAGQCVFSTLNHGLRPIRLQALSLAQPYDHNSPQLLFQSWYPAEPLHRWSTGNSASITFTLDKQEPLPAALTLSANSFGRQRVEILLNEQSIYTGESNGAETTLNIPLSSGITHIGNNSLRFVLPDAQQPQTADPRVLALAFKSLQLN